MGNSTPGSGKIRVLIVDDIAETRENIKKLVYFEDDIEVVGMASNGREGIEVAGRLQPDVVLMDINMPEMDGITASETISAKHPNVQVVIMSVQSESDYLRRSMLAGAREFLIKPFSGDELVTSIRRVHQLGLSRRVVLAPPPTAPPPITPLPSSRRGAKIIAVLGTKGGSGASTLAVNLAVALKEETKERVALIDANFEFGDIAVLLNLPTSRTIVDLTGPSVVDEEVVNGTMASHSSGVKVLLAPPRPEMAELVTSEQVKKILDILRNMFDYVVIDLWRSFQESMLAFLDASDQVLLVSTTDIPAIKNAKLFFELADALGYPAEKTSFILNKEDGRSGIAIKDIQASIRHPVRVVLSKDERLTTTAINRGMPLLAVQRSSVLAQSIISLARQLRRVEDRRPAGAPEALAPARRR